jgi:hypothetical protein
MPATSEGRARSDDPKPAAWRRLAARVATLPLALRGVLMLAAVLHGVGLSWGMPASDAWDNDGIAPRDILPGLAQTFTPGEYFTYPPAQLLLLAILTLPVTLLAAVRAGSTSVATVIHVILAPAYMTAFTMTARVVVMLMSLGIIVAIAAMTDEIAGPRTPSAVRPGTFAALLATLGVPFTYYSHVSNLDVPYLFWASLGALWMVRAIARREPRRLGLAMVFAVLAIATKDQAYAMFVLAGPACGALWLLADPWARQNARQIAREIALGALKAGPLLLLLDGAVTNPSGFRRRLAFLSGSASQDFATYRQDLTGRIDNFLDAFRSFGMHYPRVAAIFVVLGLALTIHRARKDADRPRIVAALVPLAIALSFTLAFNMVARRVEERFSLPQMLFAAVYGGAGLAWAWERRGAPRVACVAVLFAAGWDAVRVDATFLREPRYEAEAFLAQHAIGETVEVHGLNVYLPRFPEGAHVTRVGPTPTDKRNPMPGITEVQAPFSNIAERSPRFIVVSGCYTWRFDERDFAAEGSRISPTTVKRDASDPDATNFFRGLAAGRLGYHLVHAAGADDHGWLKPVPIHASLACPIFTYERGP